MNQNKWFRAAVNHGLRRSSIRPITMGMAIALPIVGGCGHVYHHHPAHVTSAGDAEAAVLTEVQAVQVSEIVNATGNPDYNDLRHFIHLGIVSMLEGTGRYVVEEEQDGDLPGIPAGGVGEPDWLLTIHLREVREHAGATFKIGPYSRQGIKTTVTLDAEWVASQTGESQKIRGYGEGAKGASGWLAAVNREAMMRAEGIWALDSSTVAGALEEAIPKLMLPSAVTILNSEIR